MAAARVTVWVEREMAAAVRAAAAAVRAAARMATGAAARVAGQVAEIEMEVVTDTMEAEAVKTATEDRWQGRGWQRWGRDRRRNRWRQGRR